MGSFLNGNPGQTFNNGNGMDLSNMLQGLGQALGQSNPGSSASGQNFDYNSFMQMANNMQQQQQQQGAGSGAQVQFSHQGSHDANSPALTVVVETKSVDDLMGSPEGMQQMNQLGAQLEQAMNSLSQGVHMMQEMDQAETMVDSLRNLNAETMLGGIAKLLLGQQGAGVQSLQSLGQLMQTLDQLPALKGLVEKFYRLLNNLQTSNPATAKDVQQLFASAATSLQGMMMQSMGNGGSMSGPEDMMQMLEQALQSLNANMEMMNAVVHNMQQLMNNPSFLQAVNNTHCLVRSLTGQQSTGLALGCVQQLLHSTALNGNSEQLIATLNSFMTNIVNNPQLLRSFADLMKTPNFDKTFEMIKMLVGDLNVTNSDLATAMQTMQNMLRGLLGNQRLLETLTTLLKSPGAITVYENAMEFLRNASLGDPATQQVLRVVKDTISGLWQGGDFTRAAEKIQEILMALTDHQDPGQPLSEAQRALVELMRKLLDFAVKASNPGLEGSSTTPPPTSPAASTVTPTPRPGVTDIAKETTAPPSGGETSKTPRPATEEPGTTTPSNTTTPSSTTRRLDTRDGNANGATTPVSLSGITVIIAVLAFKILA